MLTLADALDGASPEIKALFDDAEQQGWTTHSVRSDYQVRMWCDCATRHNMWFNARPDTPEYAERHRLLLLRKTCWQEGGDQ